MSKREQMRRDIQRKISQINMERRELELPHNPYDQEQRECLSIEQGDREALKRALAEKRTGTMTGKLADDPLRSAKNIGIVILTLASRAAIRGGMDPETSFTIEDAYAQQIEKLQTEEEVDRVAREAEFYYTAEVAKLRQARRDDDLTARCKTYIQQHIQDPPPATERHREGLPAVDGLSVGALLADHGCAAQGVHPAGKGPSGSGLAALYGLSHQCHQFVSFILITESFRAGLSQVHGNNAENLSK